VYATDRCVQNSDGPTQTQWNTTGTVIQTGMDCNGGIIHSSSICDPTLMRIYTSTANVPDVSAGGFEVAYSYSATCDPTQVFKTEYYIGDFSLTCGNYEVCQVDGGSTYEFIYCNKNNRITREISVPTSTCACIVRGSEYINRVSAYAPTDVSSACVADPNNAGLYRKFGASCIANNRMLTKPLFSFYNFFRLEYCSPKRY